jgi:hypothetical protein
MTLWPESHHAKHAAYSPPSPWFEALSLLVVKLDHWFPHIRIDLLMEPSSSKKVRLTIVSAEGVPSKDSNGLSDPYVKIKVEDGNSQDLKKIAKTKVQAKVRSWFSCGESSFSCQAFRGLNHGARPSYKRKRVRSTLEHLPYLICRPCNLDGTRPLRLSLRRKRSS